MPSHAVGGVPLRFPSSCGGVVQSLGRIKCIVRLKTSCGGWPSLEDPLWCAHVAQPPWVQCKHKHWHGRSSCFFLGTITYSCTSWFDLLYLNPLRKYIVRFMNTILMPNLELQKMYYGSENDKIIYFLLSFWFEIFEKLVQAYLALELFVTTSLMNNWNLMCLNLMRHCCEFVDGCHIFSRKSGTNVELL